MEIELFMKRKKELYTSILRFLESEIDSEEEFFALTKIIDDQEIVKNEQSIKEIFQLLYKIGDNHHRTAEFFDRFVRIAKYLKKYELPIKDVEIIDIYKRNKRLLHLFLEHKIIILNDSIVGYLKKIYKSRIKRASYYFSFNYNDHNLII